MKTIGCAIVLLYLPSGWSQSQDASELSLAIEKWQQRQRITNTIDLTLSGYQTVHKEGLAYAYRNAKNLNAPANDVATSIDFAVCFSGEMSRVSVVQSIWNPVARKFEKKEQVTVHRY